MKSYRIVSGTGEVLAMVNRERIDEADAMLVGGVIAKCCPNDIVIMVNGLKVKICEAVELSGKS